MKEPRYQRSRNKKYNVYSNAYDNVEPEHYGLAMTLYWSLAVNFPQMLGAFGGGFIIESFGYPMLFLSYSIFPLIGIVLCFVFKKDINSIVTGGIKC